MPDKHNQLPFAGKPVVMAAPTGRPGFDPRQTRRPSDPRGGAKRGPAIKPLRMPGRGGNR